MEYLQREPAPLIPRHPSLRQKVLGAVAVVLALGVAGQVVHDQMQVPLAPRVELVNPLTWVATPIDGVIASMDGTEQSS